MFIKDCIHGTHIQTGKYSVELSSNGGRTIYRREYIFARDYEDLLNKWKALCAKELLVLNDVDGVYMEDSDTDIFEEFLERTGATVFKGVSEWHVIEEGYIQTYPNWVTMIEHMAEQNEEMRA